MILSKSSKVIVVIQIAGAAYGATTLLVGFPDFGSRAITLLPYCILLALSMLGFVSGLLFWADKKVGYYGSVATHALQIPMLFSSVLSYKLAFGFGVFLKIAGQINIVEVNVGAPTILIFAPEERSFAFAVNLYALIALALLIRDQKLAGSQSKAANDPIT